MTGPRPEVAVGVILFDEADRVLLIRRGQPPAQGKWSLPGGRVEPGEPLQAACLRELSAETGLTADLGPLCEVFEYIDERYHYVVLDYVATAPQGQLRPGDDAVDARFFPLSAVAALDTTKGLLPVLEKGLALVRSMRR
jgi:8-oxo-dGTP diphosphatase